MDECKPLPTSSSVSSAAPRAATSARMCRSAPRQGLSLVHFSAQRKRFLWDRGCIKGLFRGCLDGVRGYQGLLDVYFVSETAQVELKSGRM